MVVGVVVAATVLRDSAPTLLGRVVLGGMVVLAGVVRPRAGRRRESSCQRDCREQQRLSFALWQPFNRVHHRVHPSRVLQSLVNRYLPREQPGRKQGKDIGQRRALAERWPGQSRNRPKTVPEAA